MPRYDYYCPANDTLVTARHPVDTVVSFWAELCFVTGHALGDTDPEAPVQKRPGTPAINVPTSDSDLKTAGFTKLVRRDTGVYENVTASGGEARYFKPGDPDSQPDLARKIRD